MVVYIINWMNLNAYFWTRGLHKCNVCWPNLPCLLLNLYPLEKCVMTKSEWEKRENKRKKIVRHYKGIWKRRVIHPRKRVIHMRENLILLQRRVKWGKCYLLMNHSIYSIAKTVKFLLTFCLKKMPVDVRQARWPIEVKKEVSPHDADRAFPYQNHAYFIKGLNWKLNSRLRSWSSPDWYFSADIAQFFFKNARWQIMFFFTAEEVFLFGYSIKNVQCRWARFFCASSTDVLFRPKLACSHLFGQENISPSRQKNIFHHIDRKKWQSTSARKDDRSRSKKEASPHDADRTFTYRHHAYFLKGLNRTLNRRHRSWSSPD